MNYTFRIEGKKVNLRTIIEADLTDYKRWSNPDMEAWKYDGPWYGNNYCDMSIGRKKSFERDQIPPFKRLEIETTEGVHIGWVTVYYKENDIHIIEFGIDIVESEYWNKGLGTEAVYLWIDYLFKERDFTRIGFSTWSGNKRMIAVGLKMGFIEECRIRKGCMVEGKFYDRVKMGILKEEWENKKRLWRQQTADPDC